MHSGMHWVHRFGIHTCNKNTRSKHAYVQTCPGIQHAIKYLNSESGGRPKVEEKLAEVVAASASLRSRKLANEQMLVTAGHA